MFLFQSKHETAEFHAAARAIGGCAVYVRYCTKSDRILGLVSLQKLLYNYYKN